MEHRTTPSNTGRPAHTTNGSARREARSVSERGLIYHLPSEVQNLKHDLTHTTGGRAAKTLVKSDNLRVVLITVQGGSTIDPHAVAGGATLHVLEGHISIHTGEVAEAIGPGNLVVLNQNLRQPVQALEDATILAVVAWTDGAGAWGEELAEGRL